MHLYFTKNTISQKKRTTCIHFGGNVLLESRWVVKQSRIIIVFFNSNYTGFATLQILMPHMSEYISPLGELSSEVISWEPIYCLYVGNIKIKYISKEKYTEKILSFTEGITYIIYKAEIE